MDLTLDDLLGGVHSALSPGDVPADRRDAFANLILARRETPTWELSGPERVDRSIGEALRDPAAGIGKPEPSAAAGTARARSAARRAYRSSPDPTSVVTSTPTAS